MKQKSKKYRRWSDKTEMALAAFCDETTMASFARFVLAFSCTGKCNGCAAHTPVANTVLGAWRRSCEFEKVLPKPSQPYPDSYIRLEDTWEPDKINSLRVVTVRHMRICSYYSTPTDYAAYIRRNYRKDISNILLSGIQLKAKVEVLKEDGLKDDAGRP